MTSTSQAASRIALPWIIALRYALAAGQLIIIGGVHWLLRISLPLAWIWIPPALIVASNVWLTRLVVQDTRASSVASISGRVGWFFVLDTLCLTALLMLSGGPNNPFSLLYLVHITVSATILTQRQTWGLGILSSVCFGALFWCYRPIPALEMHHRGDGVNLHLTGMWVGFTAASMLVAMFSARISELLRKMQEELAKKDRLASLVTLAAGAAHELNTPLGTIAVVAKELERYASTALPDAAVAEDSRLIRTEVERCRQILQRLSVEGAEPAGEPLAIVPAMELVRRAMSRFPPDRVLATPPEQKREPTLRVPEHAVEQALIALIKNGIDASNGSVRVAVRADGTFVRFLVVDDGRGMSPEALRHAGEPFYTTKEPGKGMGLGIFLVRTLADRLGGVLLLESQEGRGTTATLELPLHVAGASHNLETAVR